MGLSTLLELVMHGLVLLYAALAAAVAGISYSILRAAFTSTRNIPGPFLARFTRLWYFRTVWGAEAEKTNYALHRKYAQNGQFMAPIVRLGPNLFSIIEPEKQVYGIGSKMRKSDWYEGWKHPSPDRWTLFPDRDIARHAETRKKFQHLYSLSSLKSYEQYVDDCMDIFQDRLRGLAANGGYFDMGHWMQCYAFDVIGAITYSKRIGFLDEGRDVHGIIAALDSNMPFSTLAGIYAWAYPIVYKISEYLPGSGAQSRTKLMNYVQENKSTHEAKKRAWDVEGKGVEEKGDDAPEDFLEKMLSMRDDQKKGVTDYHCYIMGLSNIIAGSDTTAVSLSSTLYHLIKTPRAMQKLREEVRSFEQEGKLTPNTVSFAVSQEMPYLQACIKEALRLHAAVGLPLWRTVNEGGAEICGQYFPAGSEVGINAWVAHYNRDVWGADVDEFRPERWLEADNDQLKRMEHYYLPVSESTVFSCDLLT